MPASDPNKTIYHQGKVHKTDGNSVLVEISAGTACSGCHAEGSCSIGGISGKKEKYVEIPGHYDVRSGDKVTVHIEQSSGYRALALGYLMPLFIIITSLIILTSVRIPELIAGSISILLLLPYFGILFLFRSKINDRFKITLKTV